MACVHTVTLGGMSYFSEVAKEGVASKYRFAQSRLSRLTAGAMLVTHKTSHTQNVTADLNPCHARVGRRQAEQDLLRVQRLYSA